jgi:uncharacterized protein with PIN domain
MNKAEFRFYAELNDLLPEEHRSQFSFLFKGSPSVKDSIEALGVPHTEVDVILANGDSVDFCYQLKDGDRVSVYPVFETLNVAKVTRLRPEPLRETRFILDVHLGTLASKLRMLGFDSLYSNDYDDDEIVELSVKDNRIILTRDRGILMHKVVTHGYCIRSDQTDEQLSEVMRRFDLYSRVKAFHRCISCNGLLTKADKEMIKERLQPRTNCFFNEFYVCTECEQIYWKGSHYHKMKDYVHDLLKER